MSKPAWPYASRTDLRTKIDRSGRECIRLVAIAAPFLLFPPSAFSAWDFVPTPIEYQSWPEYCRVQFTTTESVGLTMPGVVRYSNATVEEWRGIIGEPQYSGLHHYCASIHFLNRSRVERDPRQRSFVLQRALDDAVFSYSRADPKSSVYPSMSVTLAQIKMDMQKPEEAEEILRAAIESQPQRPEAYMMLALVHRKQKKLDQARDDLQRADAATGGESPEIQYNLGLLNLELGDVDAAVANAKKAYAAGYPLPGLQRKLVQLGRWPKEESSVR